MKQYAFVQVDPENITMRCPSQRKFNVYVTTLAQWKLDWWCVHMYMKSQLPSRTHGTRIRISPMFSRFLPLFVNMDQIQCETVTYHTVQSNLIWYTCNVPFTLCKGVESSKFESLKEGASSLAKRSLVVKYVGVIWFLFHVLELESIRFTQQTRVA